MQGWANKLKVLHVDQGGGGGESCTMIRVGVKSCTVVQKITQALTLQLLSLVVQLLLCGIFQSIPHAHPKDLKFGYQNKGNFFLTL